MELWLDTADFQFIESMSKTLNIFGVTTNPSIMAKSKLDFQTTIHKLLDIQNGLVAVQTIATDCDGIIREAEKIYALSDRIIVKIPANYNGFKAMNYLTRQGIPVLSTAVFEIKQLILSINVGAKYIAPYLGRINNHIQLLEAMLNVTNKINSPIKIMGAAIKNVDCIVNSISQGIHALTLPPQTVQDLVCDINETTQSLEKFTSDWNQWELNDSFNY